MESAAVGRPPGSLVSFDDTPMSEALDPVSRSLKPNRSETPAPSSARETPLALSVVVIDSLPSAPMLADRPLTPFRAVTRSPTVA
jgi:hypothetical protein